MRQEGRRASVGRAMARSQHNCAESFDLLTECWQWPDTRRTHRRKWKGRESRGLL